MFSIVSNLVAILDVAYFLSMVFIYVVNYSVGDFLTNM